MRWYTITDPPGTDPVRLPSVTTILDVTMPQARRDTLVRAEMAAPVNYHLRREVAIANGLAVDQWFKRCIMAGRVYGAPQLVSRQCKRLLPLVRGIIKADGQIWTDQVVHSVDLGYAGTLDCVVTLPSGLVALLELKSSAYTIWPEAVAEAQLQAAAYYLAWGKMYPDRGLTALARPPLGGIATFHVTPYLFHQHIVSEPAALGRVVFGWTQRLKLFASRFNALEL